MMIPRVVVVIMTASLPPSSMVIILIRISGGGGGTSSAQRSPKDVQHVEYVCMCQWLSVRMWSCWVR